MSQIQEMFVSSFIPKFEALSDGLEVFRLAEMLVLGEEIVEHPQGGLQVQVDNVLGSGLQLVVEIRSIR